MIGALVALAGQGACGSAATHDGGAAGSGGAGPGGAAGRNTGGGAGGSAGSTDAATDAALDARVDGVDGEARDCPAVRTLVLSDPVVIPGTVAGGQTITMQITMTDTDPNGYISYPGAALTSSTPGVTFPGIDVGPPGASIDGTTSKSLTFTVKLAASIAPGTVVDISARAYGSGGPNENCNGFVLSFSLTTS